MLHTLPKTLTAALDGLGSFVFALSGGLLAVGKGFDEGIPKEPKF